MAGSKVLIGGSIISQAVSARPGGSPRTPARRVRVTPPPHRSPRPLVADCPLHYTSPNAPKKRDVLGTAMLAMLAGHKR
jgi:hypothetical protein